MFINTYRHPTSRMDSSSARGMVLAGILYFVAQKANVVVAPVIISGDQHGRAQSEEKIVRQGESAGRKAEGARGIEVGEAGDDDPAHGDQHAGQQQLRHPADAGDLAIEQHHGQHDDADGDEMLRPTPASATCKCSEHAEDATPRCDPRIGCSSPGQK